MTSPTESDDDKRRDEVLKRMLATPPKPHEKPDEARDATKPKKEKPAK